MRAWHSGEPCTTLVHEGGTIGGIRCIWCSGQRAPASTRPTAAASAPGSRSPPQPLGVSPVPPRPSSRPCHCYVPIGWLAGPSWVGRFRHIPICAQRAAFASLCAGQLDVFVVPIAAEYAVNVLAWDLRWTTGACARSRHCARYITSKPLPTSSPYFLHTTIRSPPSRPSLCAKHLQQPWAPTRSPRP